MIPSHRNKASRSKSLILFCIWQCSHCSRIEINQRCLAWLHCIMNDQPAWTRLECELQCEHCQMQKSIKLLLLDASFLWPGITFLLKYYVWHFLYQNFIGLSWIVCPQHQIEVKEAFQEKVIFSSNSSFSIREVFLPYVLIWRWLEP